MLNIRCPFIAYLCSRQRAALTILGLLATLGLPTHVVADNDAPAMIFPADIQLGKNNHDMQISALGRDWHLSLTPRNPVADATQPRPWHNTELPAFYSGYVVGDNTSWVRLGIKGSDVDGYLETDGTLYHLQPASRLHKSLARLSPPFDSQHVMIELSAEAQAVSPTQRANFKSSVPRAMRVGIVIDSRFNEFHNGRGLAHALSIMNGVDGLYQSQLGLAIVVDGVRIFDDASTDPMREQAGTVDSLLNSFREVRLNDAELSGDLALVHLFSGHQSSAQIIGLGWIDTACRVDGYDLSVSTPFPYAMLLAAHEMAHNLGALHDDDMRCEGQIRNSDKNIMWSRLSGNTRSEFSSCSLQHIQPTLSADCLIDNIDLQINLQARPAKDMQRYIDIQLGNNDASRAAEHVLSRTSFPADTRLGVLPEDCLWQESTLFCQHAAIAPGSTQTLSVLATLPGAEEQQVTAVIELEQLNDSNPHDNRAVLNALDIETNTLDSSTDGGTTIGNDEAGNLLDIGKNPEPRSGALELRSLALLALFSLIFGIRNAGL
ncbi:MAG: M12 family metallo-peptidase [Granulosicoccus sp.]